MHLVLRAFRCLMIVMCVVAASMADAGEPSVGSAFAKALLASKATSSKGNLIVCP